MEMIICYLLLFIAVLVIGGLWMRNRMLKDDNLALAMKDVEVYYFKELSDSPKIFDNPFMPKYSPGIIELIMRDFDRNGRVSEYRMNEKKSLDQLSADHPSRLLLIKSLAAKSIEVEYFETDRLQRIHCEKVIEPNGAIIFALPAFGTPSRVIISIAGVHFSYFIWNGKNEPVFSRTATKHELCILKPSYQM